MAIRIRVVDNYLIAICAARSIPKEGDIYLDDGVHYALMSKFALDFMENFGGDLPYEVEAKELMAQEENNNSNRDVWEVVYGR